MSEPWELVLHHDYRGMPGVIFDRSPGRGAHGRSQNLNTPGDFLADGATAGSGAVRLRGGNSAVKVELEQPWNALNGVIITIVCSGDTLKRDGTLFDSDSIQITCSPTAVQCTLKTANQTLTRTLTTTNAPGTGWATILLTYNQVFALWGAEDVGDIDGPVQMGLSQQAWGGTLTPVRRIAIGNRLNGGHGAVGLIDDVQVQRLDPLQVDRVFRRRPVDVSVRHCWDDWGRKLLTLLDEDPECANRIAALVTSAQTSLFKAARQNNVASRAQQAATDYATHWAAGQLGQIASDALPFIAFLKSKGIDLGTNPELRAVLTDPCFLDLLRRLPPPTCDPDFTAMIDAIAEGA